MTESGLTHFALIPAKKNSFRCAGKNWREFHDGLSLVDHTLSTLPPDLFGKVIVSTDNPDYAAPEGVELHRRAKALAERKSTVHELIHVIIKEYGLSDRAYLWLLNPTAPFRSQKDFAAILRILRKRRPPAVVSTVNILSFIWENERPLFETTKERLNTEDFPVRHSVENGMFYVFRVEHFLRQGNWYGKGIELYRQETLWSSVDIDTEEDFNEARAICANWAEQETLKSC